MAVFSMLRLVTAGNRATAAFLVPHPSIGVRHSRRRMIHPVEATLLHNKVTLTSCASEPGEFESRKRLEETLANERAEGFKTNIEHLEKIMEKNFQALNDQRAEDRKALNDQRAEDRKALNDQRAEDRKALNDQRAEDRKAMEKNFQEIRNERKEDRQAFLDEFKAIKTSLVILEKDVSQKFMVLEKDVSQKFMGVFAFLIAMSVAAGSMLAFKDFIPFFK
jgi:hypothetical protein